MKTDYNLLEWIRIIAREPGRKGVEAIERLTKCPKQKDDLMGLLVVAWFGDDSNDFELAKKGVREARFNFGVEIVDESPDFIRHQLDVNQPFTSREKNEILITLLCRIGFVYPDVSSSDSPQAAAIRNELLAIVRDVANLDPSD